MDSNERLSTDEILSQFSDPNLASHAYLDVHFQKYNQMTQLQELHSQSSQLLSQLDHATEDLTWQLEDIMTDLKKSGPRLSYQIELLKSGVAGLVSDIEEIASPKIEEIKRRRDAEVNEDKHDSESKSNKKDIITAATIPGGQAVSSNPTIARLQQLETVRSRMKQVESVLQKAQTFDEIELTNSIVSSIENGDLEGALTTVGEAAELIQVWKGTSVYNGRAKFVAQLRKKIEVALGQQDAQESQGMGSGPGSATSPLPESERSSKWYRGSNSTNNSNSPASSRPETPNSNSKTQDEGYYGIFGQLSRKIGY